MSIKANGTSISWSVLSGIALLIFTAGGGWYQSAATADGLAHHVAKKAHEGAAPDIARNEARIKANEDAIKEIKESQLRSEAKLDAILRQLINDSRREN